MNKLTLFLCLLLCDNGFSQSQDLKQLELDIQKLAQLKSMLSEMYRGYSILDKGYSSIKDLTQSNFNMHKNYLDKLLDVSVAVKKDPKVNSVSDLQMKIEKTCLASEQLVVQSAVLSVQEKMAITKLFQNINARSAILAGNLRMIITPGVLRMDDAERMQAIDRIENAMKEKWFLVQQQQINIETLMTLRSKQNSETRQLKSLY